MMRAEPVRLLAEAIETPIGDFVLAVDEAGTLVTADFADCLERCRHLLAQRYAAGGFSLDSGTVASPLKAALAAYFAGELPVIDAIPVRSDGTPFQAAVWSALRTLPPGRPISYGELAHRLDRPAAIRAVGHANAVNLVSIVVPCHRLVGADGSLTGYGGGIARKRWLLEHEARFAAAP